MCPAQRLGKRGELQGLFLAEDRPARPGLQLVHPTISAVQPLFYPALFPEAVRAAIRRDCQPEAGMTAN